MTPTYHQRPGAPRGPNVQSMRLTRRQRQALDIIHESLRTRGYAPTWREIGDAMSISSTCGVNDHLLRLEAKGYIERASFDGRVRARALVLTPLALALYPERTRDRETDPGSIDEGET